MRLVVFLVTLCYSMPSILAQINVYNFHLRDIHYTGEIGHKPLKYKPLSTKDQIASEKAADVVDFIQLVPKIDPLKRAILPPVGIDIPLFFLKGKVYMKRVIMSGLKQLELRHLEMRMINLRTDVNINFPLISIAGDFYLQAYISFVPLFLKCHLSLDLYDLNIMATTGGRKIRSPWIDEVVLQINNIFASVNIKDVKVNITDIEMNGFEEMTGPPVMQLFSDSRRKSKNSTFEKILGVGLKMINRKLLNIPFEAFEEYITSETY